MAKRFRPNQKTRLVEATERQSDLLERDKIAEALLDANQRTYDYINPAVPRFVQIEKAAQGGDMFGLKTDGSIWKTNAAATPLVWTQIS